MGECFNCSGEASRTYTLVLETGETLQDREMCRSCFDFFDGADRIRVLEAPVLVRGGDPEAE